MNAVVLSTKNLPLARKLEAEGAVLVHRVEVNNSVHEMHVELTDAQIQKLLKED